MSAAGASIRAGGAFVELITKNDGLYNGLRQAMGRIKAFSAAFISVGSKMSGIAAGLGNSLLYAAHGASIAGGESAKFLNGFNKEGLLAIQTTGGIAGKLGTVKSKASAVSLAIGSLGSQFRMVGSFMSGMGRTAMTFGSVLSAPLLYAAKSASDAEEALNKFMSVFGKEGPAAKKFVEDIAVEFGRSRTQIMASMSAFQSIFVGLGFGQREAHKLSQRFQRMAIDFASFHNISEQETMGRFLSAMSGSAEVLDQFGVNIRAQALEQEFLRMGIKKTAQTATESEKTMARLNIIQGAMQRQGVIGDALRTSGSAQNQMKRLQGILEDMVVTVGKALLPSLIDIMRKVGDAAKAFAAWAKDNQGVIVTVGGIVLGLTAAGVALMALGPAITAVGAALGIVAFAFKGLVAVALIWKGVMLAMMTPLGIVLKILDSLFSGIALQAVSSSSALATLGRGFTALLGIAQTTWGGITDLIAAGDWGGAVKMGWLGIQIAWSTGIAYLSKAWRDFSGFFVDVYAAASTTLAKVISGAWTVIEVGAKTLFGSLGTGWDLLVYGMTVAFEKFVEATRIGWAQVKRASGAISLIEMMEEIGRAREGSAASIQAAKDKLDANARWRNSEIAGAGQRGVNRQRDIDATAEREQRLRDQARAAANAGDDAEIARLSAELNAMRDRAKFDRENAEYWNSWAVGGGAGGIGSMSTTLANATGKLEAKGTFSAAAAGAIGASSLKKSEDLLAKIERNTGDMARPAFT